MRRGTSGWGGKLPPLVGLVAVSLAGCMAGQIEGDGEPGVVEQGLAFCGELTFVGASGGGAYPATNAIDRNLNTRWVGDATSGPVSLVMDLGIEAQVCQVEITWYLNNTTRSSRFEVHASSDGASYDAVLTNAQSTKPASPQLTLKERYEIRDVSARYLKIIGTGTDIDPYTSIVEVSAVSCEAQPASGSSASGTTSWLPRLTDNDFTTWWSHLIPQGGNSWAVMDLGASRTVSSVRIAWRKGEVRTSDFSISLSADDASYTTVYTGTSRSKIGYEDYDFPDQAARYVKITVTRNTDGYASIDELRITGPNPRDCAALPTLDRGAWLYWKNNPGILDASTLDALQERGVNLLYVSGITSSVAGTPEYQNNLKPFLADARSRGMKTYAAFLEDPNLIDLSQADLESRFNGAVSSTRDQFSTYVMDCEPHTLGRPVSDYIPKYVDLSNRVKALAAVAGVTFGEAIPPWYHQKISDVDAGTGLDSLGGDFLVLMSYTNDVGSLERQLNGISTGAIAGTQKPKTVGINVKDGGSDPYLEGAEIGEAFSSIRLAAERNATVNGISIYSAAAAIAQPASDYP